MPSVLSKIKIHEDKPKKVKCIICGAKLSNFRSLRRHQKTQHQNYAPHTFYECAPCGWTTSQIKKLQTHMDIQHECSQPKYCFYCNKFFVEKIKYMDHMNRMHGLPLTWVSNTEADYESYIKPSERAFHGKLKSYDLEVNDHELDLQSFMRSKQPEIDDIISLNTQNSQQKVRFIAMLQLVKVSDQDENSSQPDRTNFFAASRNHVVDFGGLSNANRPKHFSH